MRFVTLAIGAAALLVAASASATESKGDSGGKGGGGPGRAPTAGTTGGEQGADVEASQSLAQKGSTPLNPDELAAARGPEKPWEVAATFESHRLMRQEDLNGAGQFKVFDVLFASAHYDVTERNRVSVSGGVLQYFLADSGETGYRSTDIYLAYSRLIPLPGRFNWRITPSTTIPISFYSQLQSNITQPGLAMSVSRKFGDLFVEARTSGGLWIDRYTTSAPIGSDASTPGGQPNPKWRLGGSVSAEYSMPFHRPLSLGAALVDQYVWFYEVGQAPAGTTFYQATQDPQNPSGQPWQQSYGGELFVRYLMPDLGGMKSDLTVAVANGDPMLGYPSVMHDTGTVHPYFLYRQNAEVYAALSARY